MEERGGCFNFLAFIAFVVALYIWVTNVHTIRITEQLPPPVDSWTVVYPKFRDDVSAQLLNTQQIAGATLDATSYMKIQNADLQNSVDLLLGNLGIMKQESYRESIKQQNEQRILTIASVIFGWFLGAFVTKDATMSGIKTIKKNVARWRRRRDQVNQESVEDEFKAEEPITDKEEVADTSDRENR